MKKFALALSIVVAPVAAHASIHDVRTGPGVRVGSTSMSAGLVFERATFDYETMIPDVGSSTVDSVSSLSSLVDLQMPVGPLSARVRVPWQLSAGQDGADTGLGNASVGAAWGMDIGLGVEASLTAGVDLLLPSQSADDMSDQSWRSSWHFDRKLMSANPYAVVTLATPVVETRLDVDVIYGISQEEHDNGGGDALDLKEHDNGGGDALDLKVMTLGLTGELSVMPAVGVLVGLDHFRDLSGDEAESDTTTFGRAGIHAGLAMVDVSVEANFVLAARSWIKDNAGLGLVASVSAGF